MLQLIDIKKEYLTGDTKVEALKCINLQFRENEFVSILGPSGSGKTTIAEMCMYKVMKTNHSKQILYVCHHFQIIYFCYQFLIFLTS